MVFEKGKIFDPIQDIPDLSGQVVLVTGGNNGLGKETVLQLAKHKPAKIYLGARNGSKAETAIVDIKREVPDANIIFLKVDLASFSSIAIAAKTFLAENDRLDILINNAGIFATPPGLTDDGYEIQFGTNYMGPVLLTKLLLPALEKATSMGSDAHIVMVSSALHNSAPRDRLLLSEVTTKLERLSTMARYGQSKLAELYFTRGLAKRYPAITSVAVHPGIVRTGIADGPGMVAKLVRFIGRFTMVDVATGALNQLWAATVPAGRITNGAMFYPVGKEFKGRNSSADAEMAEELWRWTESEIKGMGF